MNVADQMRFFIVYPMDLEDLGLLELKEKYYQHFPLDTLSIIGLIPGGIEIECPLAVGLSLNSILRTPTRILLRIGEFKCRDAPKLFLKISKFNWAPWLIGQTPEVLSSTVNSRLFDSRKIEKAITDGVLQYYRHKPVKKKYLDHLEKTDLKNLPKIYFRSVDDVCTLSLDTSGERLHLRNEKLLTGLAPLRENLAALLLKELQSHLPPGDYTLIDPMCGSGTFLWEAHRQNTVTTRRDFSFEHFPLVLDHRNSFPPIEEKNPHNPYVNFKGFEADPHVAQQAHENCKGTSIQIETADLFSQGKITFPNAVVIINPPYGIRVGERGSKENEINLVYYLKVIEAIQNKFAPQFLGIIIPADFKLPPKNFKILSKRPFKNGGIDVVFYVLGFK